MTNEAFEHGLDVAMIAGDVSEFHADALCSELAELLRERKHRGADKRSQGASDESEVDGG